jgi:hypothetical protein
MGNYWLRIGLGALAIFVVGMFIVSGARRARTSVEELAEGTGPITVPLAFLPFEIDGQRAGTLRRLRVFRDSLQEPTRIEVQISVQDSSAMQRFAACILAIESRQGKVQPNDFRCLGAGDTAGRDLVQFGDLELRGYPGTYPLYGPRDEVDNFKRSAESSLTEEERIARAAADSARELQFGRADSLRQHADSVHRAALEQADSLRRAAGPRDQ